MAGLFDTIFGSDDPSTADPQTGLLESQRRQLAFNSLGQIGATLLAAGQNIMPGERARLLAGLGQIPAQTQEMQSQMIQQGLANQRAVAMKRANKNQQDLDTLIRSPEFQQQFQGLPPAQKAIVEAAAKSGDVTQMLGALQQAQQYILPKFNADGSVFNPATGIVANPYTGQRFDVNNMTQPGQGGGAPVMPGQAGGPPQAMLTGDDYLKTLPPALAAQVKGIAEGRIPMPTGQVMRTGYGQSLMTALSQYDPGFEGTDYGSRFATAKGFAAGKEAQQITALNTAIHHLGTLYEKGRALNNYSVPAANAVDNWVQKQFGDDRTTNFLAAAHPVAEELSRVFKGANLSDSEIKAWMASLDPNMSPAQMQGSIQTLQKLMEGRVQALQEQYKRGFGKEPKPLIEPKSQAILDYINNNPLDGPAPKKEGGAQADPMEGRMATGPNGEKIVRRGGQWVPVR